MALEIKQTKEKGIVELNFDIDKKELENALFEIYRDNLMYFNIPGFRKGKAPFEIVMKTYGPDLFYNDALARIFDTVCVKEMEKQNFRPYSDYFEPEIKQLERGKNVIITTKIASKPEVKIDKLPELKVEVKKEIASKKDVDEKIKQEQEKNTRITPIEKDRALKKGDFAILDFKGFIANEKGEKGKAFEGGEAKDYQLEIGSNSFIPGFEEQMIGMKKGETKDLKLKFPEEYFSEELKGKDVIFEVTLHDIKEKIYPELDDEFAKDLGFDTLEEYRKDVEKDLNKGLQLAYEEQVKKAILNVLASKIKVDIHEKILESKAEQKLHELLHSLEHMGFTLETYMQITNLTRDQIIDELKEESKTALLNFLITEAVYEIEKDNVKKFFDKKENIEVGKEIEKAVLGGKDIKKAEEHELADINLEKTLQYLMSIAKITEPKEKTKKTETTTKSKAKDTKSKK